MLDWATRVFNKRDFPKEKKERDFKCLEEAKPIRWSNTKDRIFYEYGRLLGYHREEKNLSQ